MLNRDRLIELYRELRDQNVLSVYIDGDGRDPAERRVWALELERGLDRERDRIDADRRDQIEAFDRARGHVMRHLDRFSNFLPAKGWVGFATADSVAHAEDIPVPMPNLVRWERGLRAAPYVRALKQDRMVVGVLVDSRKARVFTYRGGTLEERADLLADMDIGDVDATTSHRASTHTGTRGETGTDAARRALDVSATKMRNRLADVVAELAGHDGLVVLGGTAEAEAAVGKQLDHLKERVIHRPSMHLTMADSEIRSVIEDAASELSGRLHGELLSLVMDQARSRGKGSLGREATEEALRGGRVDTLLVTRGFRERHPELADHFVGTAFEQGAGVEELSGESAGRLEVEGEGVGARLRYIG